MNKKYQSVKQQITNKPIYLNKSIHEKELTESEIKFIKYVWNEKCFYFSHIEDEFIFFFRTKRDKKPDLVMKKNEPTIAKISMDENKKRKLEYVDTLRYSYNDFIKYVPLKNNIKSHEVEKKIDFTIKTLQDNFDDENIKEKSVIITNEGAGKSKIVIDNIRPGEIYSAPDRDILDEKEKYMRKIEKEYLRFYSNADIIYTTIYEMRGSSEEAEKISNKYLEMCQTLDRNFDKNELSEYLGLISQQNTEFILEELKDIKEDELVKNENSSISLLKFLKDNEDITDEEKKFMTDYYNYLIAVLVKGTKVITCTTHKLKILLQKMKYKRRMLIFCDEIVNDVHGNVSVVNKNTINEKTWKYLSLATHLNESNGFTDSMQNKYNKLKEERGVKEWVNLCSYYKFMSMIEIKDDEKNWMKKNDTSFVILTTEEKSKMIFPNAEFYDFRHKIYNDNINIICIDQMNSSTKENKAFKGKERPLIIKSCVENILGIKSEYYIANGVGHSMDKNLPNHYNIRGHNNLFNKLKKEESPVLGIAITSPHPESINLHKGLYWNANSNNFKIDENNNINKILFDYEDEMIETIVNGEFHQAVGRTNGYRHIENGKTYIFITSQLLSKLKPYYITENIFHFSNFKNQKYFREEYQEIYNFMHAVNSLLNLKTDEYKKKFDEKHIKELIEKVEVKNHLKKQLTYSFDEILKIFKTMYKKFLTFLEKKLNKIKYVFHIITELSNWIFPKTIDRRLRHMYKRINEILFTIVFNEEYLKKNNEGESFESEARRACGANKNSSELFSRKATKTKSNCVFPSFLFHNG